MVSSSLQWAQFCCRQAFCFSLEFSAFEVTRTNTKGILEAQGPALALFIGNNEEKAALLLCCCPQPTPFPAPFPRLLPLTCSALPPPSAWPSSCSPTLPSQAPISHQQALSSLWSLQGSLCPQAPWGPLHPQACQPLPLRALPSAPGLPLCDSLFLCSGSPFWPFSGLQPPGQTSQLSLHLSCPVTCSFHLPTFGSFCRPFQGPNAPATSGHPARSELCESGTCWTQGAAQGGQLWGRLAGPPALREVPFSTVSSQPLGDSVPAGGAGCLQWDVGRHPLSLGASGPQGPRTILNPLRAGSGMVRVTSASLPQDRSQERLDWPEMGAPTSVLFCLPNWARQLELGQSQSDSVSPEEGESWGMLTDGAWGGVTPESRKQSLGPLPSPESRGPCGQGSNCASLWPLQTPQS